MKIALPAAAFELKPASFPYALRAIPSDARRARLRRDDPRATLSPLLPSVARRKAQGVWEGAGVTIGDVQRPSRARSEARCIIAVIFM
ncbi:hypothetical protein CR492_06700 [Methylocella silvestris]|uniref:Uncharacterized protein n=1 Tax=Methylocella silvestris TaxID=199596 RepID=A0A2J7TIW3_METSI|nr:hypothetical protein CR492_06700 [Methylocella silvestris]